MTRYIIPAGTECEVAANDDNRPYKKHTTKHDGEGELWPHAARPGIDEMVIATERWVYRVPRELVRVEDE